MFLSFSKTLTRFGGFHLGVRMTKKNSWLMLFILMFAFIFKAMWYTMIMCFWMMYAVFYCMFYPIKKLVSLKRKKTD